MKLRPYQTEAMTKARAAYAAGARGVLVVAPTGSGKTVLAAACAKSALDRGGCVLFIVPRREIVKQTVAKLEALGLDPSIVAAGLDRQRDERVTVCMAQTMVRRPADCVKPPTLVIVDEAHLAVADTYRRILERWPSARSLLLTATPCRTDGRGLGEIADQMVETTGTRQLIADGHLVPPVVWSAKTPDMKGIRKTVSGELSPKHAGAKYAASVILGDTLDQIRQRCHGRTVLVFASSVEHSKALRDALKAEGYKAAHIDGGTNAAIRARVLTCLEAGELDVVTNYGCLTEGLDVPSLGAVVVARCTQSRALWFQMVGRGLRPSPDKTDCVVIDQGGNAHRHGHPAASPAWTLEGKEKQERGDVPTCTTCEQCRAIYERRPDAPGCPRCGAVPVPKPRREIQQLKRKELALVVPGPDGTPKPVRPMPDGWYDRGTWEQIERQRIAAGYHWRWSLHQLQNQGWILRQRFKRLSSWRSAR